ncbi:sugar transferase [Weissella paramesenteroides]|uniref:Sugar transferase n=1 Tax=Weissella paramesenteroides TaxID=1249 RepID=A0ABD4XJJ3_WEIPA|nr:sugar transferase [Weissella paramesenteroides]MDF8368731.1 sugar transferase [Weissella paramesenteroides]MDF8370876.1 sugar transferase [Weissella paramesenteroides]
MYKNTKIFLDELMGIFLIVILLIPMLIIAVLVKLTSDGPILFKQSRYGKHSRKFTIYKFRTMYIKTPEMSNQTFKNIDNFITPIGKVLRKYSLDELPQLFNIVMGNMSFIGPRPLAESDITVIYLRQKSGADRVRPGITGLAQVNGRNNILDSEKAYFDQIYVENLTLLNDTKIVFRTILNVILAKNINREKL